MHFLNLHKIECILKKKNHLHRLNIWKLKTPRKVVTSMPESSCFRTPFKSQSVHGFHALLKPTLHHFSLNFPLIQDGLRWNTSLLVRFEITGLFGNTFTADHKYSCHRSEKSPQQIQTLLSQQSNNFSVIFITILQSTQNFGRFERKGQLDRFNILEYIDPEKCGYFNA